MSYLVEDIFKTEMKATREGFGEGVIEAARKDEKVVVLCADLEESMRVVEFAKTFPGRFIEVGVAEQNMAGVGAGLAFEGYVPYMASYATFSPGRNWEQIRVSIVLSQANVKIIGSHSGVSSGKNGPSHQGTEDIALMRVLPRMVVLCPTDANQCAEAIEAAYYHDGPVYIRTCRPDTPNFTKPGKLEIGKAYKYREGKDLTILACGIQVWDSLMVAEELVKQGIECEVINVSSIKPLDEMTILASVEKTRKVVTVEDHQIVGGLGGAIAELLSEKLPTRLKRIGIQDRFGLSGEWGEVYQQVGLDRASLKKAVIDYLHE